MLCSRCKKRMAMVYISRQENGKTVNEGICLKCAKALGIKPVDDIMKNMGISEEDIEAVSDELEAALENPSGFFQGGAPALGFFANPILPQDGGASAAPSDTSDKTKEKSGADAPSAKPDVRPAKKAAGKRKYLDSYCIDLTGAAREGKLDRIVGRENEIYRVMQILNRRTKNNPCLIGEPGVGKTAITEGLALAIAEGNVPARLMDKEIHVLDLTALVAGTQFRGQFESRVKGLIDEVKALSNIILVIDEVHNLVGTGDAEGAMNAANMLKPALSRGEIQVIGATTITEYRKHIEKDAALERRFQPVMVDEPTIDETIKILEGICRYYEEYHNVTIPPELMRKAVVISERYVSDRYLPDKAIDLIDEACSNASIKNNANKELYLKSQELAGIKEEIEALATNPNEDSYKRIAELRAEECRLEEQVKKLNRKVHSVLTLDDLAKVIELWTGISSLKIVQSESERLKRLGDRLRQRVIGQDEAIESVTLAVKRARASLTPRARPVSFIFAGPTGVGKTELVKVLSEELFDQPGALIRLDMSEFMEKHAVSRIIGSPPGYVGYDEAGQLTEKVRRKPYSVVLFDEIEKAHPDVLNILLQILDDGRITDAHGRTVSFEHTIIIMTSNAGSNLKGNAAGFNRGPELLAKEKAQKALSEFLRPEFLNRIDEVIIFAPLKKESFKAIAALRLSELRQGVAERGMDLSWDDAAEAAIAEKSFSAVYGARNVRRVLQKEVEDKLVDIVLAGKDVKSVHVTAEDGRVVLRERADGVPEPACS